jgi:hypothetical protein
MPFSIRLSTIRPRIRALSQVLSTHFASSRLFNPPIRLAVVILISVSLTVFARVLLSKAKTTRQPVSTSLGKDKAKRPPIGTIITTLTRFGFEPAEFNVPAGRCLLAVRNHSGFEVGDLEISRRNGQKLLSGRLQNGKNSLDNVIDLVPGEYEINISGRPEWVCKIIVNSN